MIQRLGLGQHLERSGARDAVFLCLGDGGIDDIRRGFQRGVEEGLVAVNSARKK